VFQADQATVVVQLPYISYICGTPTAVLQPLKPSRCNLDLEYFAVVISAAAALQDDVTGLSPDADLQHATYDKHPVRFRARVGRFHARRSSRLPTLSVLFHHQPRTNIRSGNRSLNVAWVCVRRGRQNPPTTKPPHATEHSSK